VNPLLILRSIDTWILLLIVLILVLIITYSVYDRYHIWKRSKLNWWQFLNPFKRLSSPFEVKMVFISFGIFISIIIIANLVYFLFLN